MDRSHPRNPERPRPPARGRCRTCAQPLPERRVSERGAPERGAHVALRTNSSKRPLRITRRGRIVLSLAAALAGYGLLQSLPANAAVVAPAVVAPAVVEPAVVEPAHKPSKSPAKPKTQPAPAPHQPPAPHNHTKSSTATQAHQSTRATTASRHESLIRNVWPDQLETQALAIAQCESTLRNISSKPNGNGTRDHGLFQINDGGTLQGLEGSIKLALNPEWNTRAALRLHRERGWQPWTCARKLGLL